MKKLFLIGMKDLKLVFRDRTALTFMLLAPFLLTVALGFVTGSYGMGNSSGIEQIPVLVVNQDEGELGSALADLFASEDLSDLVLTTLVSDPAEARRQVDADAVAAAIIIPAGFTDSIIPPDPSAPAGEVVSIEVYKNPTRPVGSGVVQSIVEEFLSRVETGRVGGEVILTQMLTAGLISPAEVNSLVADLADRQALAVEAEPALSLQASESGEEQQAFDPMAYMAPGMALMFLMFTVSNGGRSILAERALGTLPRLFVSPTHGAQVLIGKVFGVYLTGVMQMLILVGAGSVLFGLQWGDPLGVLVLILAAVYAATGWGMLITALTRTPGQVAAIGSAIMLTFGILGGSFIQVSIMPDWYQWLSRITPNAWGLDGFTTLGLGGNLSDLGAPLLGLAVMGTLLTILAVLSFNRRPLVKK